MVHLRKPERRQRRVLGGQDEVEGGRCLHSDLGYSTPESDALTTRPARPTEVAREKEDMSGTERGNGTPHIPREASRTGVGRAGLGGGWTVFAFEPGSSAPESDALTTRPAKPTKLAREKEDMSGTKKKMVPPRNPKRRQGRVLGGQDGVEGGRCLHSNSRSSTPESDALTTRPVRPT